MSERLSAERLAVYRANNDRWNNCTPAYLADIARGLLNELDAVTRERDEALKANHVVAIPEPLAADVLDEIEAAIGAGRAMGHGAWAILNRAWRLLHPSFRADQSRFKEYS